MRSLKSRFLRLNGRRKEHDTVHLSTRAAFPANENLVKDQLEAADKLGPNSMKPLWPKKQPAPLETELPIG
jgi:hypothetical protein